MEENENKAWTYSENTNQYQTQRNSEYYQQRPSNEYGTQYGYYGNSQQSRGYYGQGNSQWDFNSYESKKQKKSSGKGFKIFIIIVSIILGICLITLATAEIYKKVTGKDIFSIGFSIGDIKDKVMDKISGTIPEIPEESGDSESSASTESKQETSHPAGVAPDLDLGKKPSNESGETLSATEVYSTVNPSVVGIIQYQYSKSMDPTGSGSGVIISTDGYIITNAHVISGAEAVKVVLYNEEEYDATIIGSDGQTDIAVLKITAENLVPAKLGDSSLIEVGETVYVLGNPGGLTLQSSFTKGIISGLNRTITTSDSIYPITVIQTDAAINPGNSGGALINEFGQVIGITNSKLVSTQYEGVGFAIPTATAVPVAQELIEKGYISGRAILGITARTIDSTTAKYYSVPQGIQIVTINEDSSFKGSDAKVGDIITAINGKSVSTMEELQQVLSTMKPNMQADITLYRYAAQRENDKQFTITVRLIENKQ